MRYGDRVVRSYSGVPAAGPYDRQERTYTPAPKVRPIIGLDLGQVSDPSALAFIDKFDEKPTALYHATFLSRFEIGTSYPTIVEKTVNVLKSDAVKGKAKPILAIDATGVGRPVADMFRGAIKDEKLDVQFYPIVITGGQHVNVEHMTWHVPKRMLVSTVQVAIQTGRFKFAEKLPEAQTLAREMQNFRLTLTEAKNDTYEGRSGTHDDLLLAVACALWAGNWYKGDAVMPRSYSYSRFS